MKKQTTLTASEIEYIHTCWTQMYNQAYPNFIDYLNICIRTKEVCGSVYN